jgi:hypothetical protein
VRDLGDPSGGPLQHKDVALAAVPVRHKGNAGAVRREHGLVVIVRPEGELLGNAAPDRQSEQVAEDAEDQPLAVRRDGDVGRGDLGSLELETDKNDIATTNTLMKIIALCLNIFTPFYCISDGSKRNS